MTSLKEYRDKELKFFLVANILLMIFSSGIIKLENTEIERWIVYITNLINITIFFVISYILTFVFDSIIPSSIKLCLLFLGKKQPSYTIFTDMLEKLEDNRFTIEDVKDKYENIYKKINEASPKNKDQTAMWYKIYNKHRDHSIIFGSNRDYLMLRDMHAQLITLSIVYLILCFLFHVIFFSVSYIIYLLCMIVILNIAGRTQGKRMVYNVIAIDINE